MLLIKHAFVVDNTKIGRHWKLKSLSQSVIYSPHSIIASRKFFACPKQQRFKKMRIFTHRSCKHFQLSILFDEALTISMMRWPHTKHFSAVCWKPEYCREDNTHSFLSSAVSSEEFSVDHAISTTCSASHLTHELVAVHSLSIEGANALFKPSWKRFPSQAFVSQLSCSSGSGDLSPLS